MPDNWERALEAARGDWIMLLADKYMLMPGAVEALRSLCPSAPVISYGCAVLRQSIESSELHDHAALGSRGGELTLPRRVDVLGLRKTAVDLGALVASAAYPSQYPMLYTALARRSVCDAARRASGRFFLGSCPDVASALQLLASTETWLQTTLPVVLVQYPGAPQPWSTGASTLARSELSAAFFREFGLPRPAIERTVSGAIYATMLAFARARPGLVLPLDRAWVSFARRASWEIDGMPAAQRLVWQARLLGYVQRDTLRPCAAFAQARAALGGMLPRSWRARRLEAVAAAAVERRQCRDRSDAIAAVASTIRAVQEQTKS